MAYPGAMAKEKPEGLYEAIQKELACPVDWDAIVPIKHGGGIAEDMRAIWKDQVEATEAEGADLLGTPELMQTEDQADLVEVLRQVRDWIPKVRESYKKQFNSLINVKVADRQDYSKHYPPAGLTRDQIIARTERSDSLFFQEITVAVQQRCMWEVFVMHPMSPFSTWREGVADASFVIETLSEIGASKGAATTLVRVLFNAASGVVHLYPVPPGDAPADEVVTYAVEHLL